MIYSYYSCKTTDIKPIQRCIRNFMRNGKYWGIFSFQPQTMTCIEKEDIKVLQKYEPFGLVMYKWDIYIMFPKYIVKDYYELYDKILDPIKDAITETETEYMIDMRTFKKRLRV